MVAACRAGAHWGGGAGAKEPTKEVNELVALFDEGHRRLSAAAVRTRRPRPRPKPRPFGWLRRVGPAPAPIPPLPFVCPPTHASSCPVRFCLRSLGCWPSGLFTDGDLHGPPPRPLQKSCRDADIVGTLMCASGRFRTLMQPESA